MGKVCCLISRESLRLIRRIHRCALSWLRKVRIGVSSFVVLGHAGIDCCSASTIEHLKNTLEKGEVVVFFYCDFQNKRSMSATEVTRSLLSQLIRHLRDLRVDPGDLPDKILKEKSEGTLLLTDLNKLRHFVSRAANCFHPEPIIVIDAVDECVDIEGLSGALATLGEDDVRLLVTSRPDQTMKGHFARYPSLPLEDVAKELAEDIELHVNRELESRKQLSCASGEMKNGVRAELTRQADGR